MLTLFCHTAITMPSDKFMKPFQFNDRFFQRGQTWRECLETWEPERDAFLRSASQKPLLQKTLSELVHNHKGARFGVLYHFASIDSALALPAIGATFTRVEHLEVRFFNMSFFFPALNPHFGRKVPQVLALNDHGHCQHQWGPRPPEVAAILQTGDEMLGRELDHKLRRIPRQDYLAALDRSLSEFIGKTNTDQSLEPNPISQAD